MPKTWTFFAFKMLEMIVWHSFHTYAANPTYSSGTRILNTLTQETSKRQLSKDI